MGVIRFRLADEVEARLKAAGIDPGPWAKAKLLELGRDVEADATLATLERYSKKVPRPVEEIVRGMRDER